MNTIKITTELSPEDRKILTDLTGSITLLASVLGNMQPTEVQQKIIQEATAPEHPIDAPTAHLEPPTISKVDLERFAAAGEAVQAALDATVDTIVDAATPTPEVTPVSFAEFQKAVTQAVAKGAKQKAAAKEIINKYATSVSSVPEDKRAEVMAELAKI